MRLPILNRFQRRQRINQLVDRLGACEQEMRNLCVQLIDLTEEGDDLHIEVRRLLEQLD